MTIKQVMETLDAELLTPEADLTREVHAACGSDMMSDVLAYVKDQAVLVTGLNNPQVVRTADHDGHDLHRVCARQKAGRRHPAAGGGPGHRRVGYKAAHVRGVRPAVRKRAARGDGVMDAIRLHYTVPGTISPVRGRPAPI